METPERSSPSSLDEVLRIRPGGEDRFTTRLESHGGVSFGGQTIGCATRAAAQTCEGRSIHSLHACFLRPVPPEVPVELRVERVSDGRRLARRRVEIRRDGRLLFDMVASFAAPGDGPDFQEAGLSPGTPPPEELPGEEEVARAEGWTDYTPWAFEWRWIGTPWRPETPQETSRYLAWVRPRHPLVGVEPGLVAAGLAFLSDFHSHWPVARKLGAHFEPEGYASLDQAVWIHRDLPWDDWCLLTSECDIGHAGRALGRRTLHTRDGRLVASMAQEALIPGASSGGQGR